jgi:hypothetical protein
MNGDLKRVQGFELLSDSARERLRRRVIDAGGNIDAVADDVRAKLDEHDQSTERAAAVNQAKRPFLLAQLTYLDALAKAQTVGDEPLQKRGLFSRLGGVLRGQRAS